MAALWLIVALGTYLLLVGIATLGPSPTPQA
jgi:hypothetical protein